MPDDHSPIDEIIKNAMRRGEFDGLPGTGKPLPLDDEGHIPSELRMAHRILKQNDLAPDWILIGKEIEAERVSALDALRAAARAYLGASYDARHSGDAQQTLAASAAAWAEAQESFRATYQKLNQKILRYNLKLPPGFPHKSSLNAERELARLNRRA